MWLSALPSSSVALCKLLQHGINTDDRRLQDIRVKGEELYSMDEGVRTRSKSAKSGCPGVSLHTVTVSDGSGQRQKLRQGGAAPARCWSLPSTTPGTRGPAPSCGCGCRVASGRSRSSGPPGL